jgi:putative membrane protein
MHIRFYAAIAVLCVLGGGEPAQCEDKPTDPQIAHIAYTAGQLDITAAKQALSKSKNKDVLAFAQDMERDHEAVNKQALDLVKKLNVIPEDNDTSRSLSKAAAEKQTELAKLSGAAYDKAYITNEVAYHKTVNGALESLLIPSANNAELKSLLQTGLKIFQGHEQHAEHVAAELKQGASTCRSGIRLSAWLWLFLKGYRLFRHVRKRFKLRSASSNSRRKILKRKWATLSSGSIRTFSRTQRLSAAIGI